MQYRDRATSEVASTSNDNNHRGGGKMKFKYMATVLAVVILALAAAFMGNAKSAQAADNGQCNTNQHIYVYSPGGWINNLRAEGVLEQTAAVLSKAGVGYNQMDLTLPRFAGSRTMVLRLHKPERIADYMCHNGVLKFWKYEVVPADTPMIVVLPKYLAKKDVRAKPAKGFVPKNIRARTIGQAGCSNPSPGTGSFTIYVRVHVHVVKPKPRHKPKVVYVYAWKWAYKDGGWKNGLHFGLYAWKHRYGHHWTMTSGKWTRLAFKQGHVPPYLCEIIKYPWQAKGPKGAACQKPHLYKGRLVVIYTNYYQKKATPVPKPTPPTPPPPTIVITQVCSNGQIVVVVGNGNNINQNGNSNGGNCNGNTTPPPSAPCTPPTVMGPNGRCIKPETPEGTQQNNSAPDNPPQNNPGQNTGPTPGAPPTPTDPQPSDPTTTTTTGTNSGVDGTGNTPTGTSSGTGGTQSSPPPPPTPPDDGGQGDSGATGSGTNTTDPGPPTP